MNGELAQVVALVTHGSAALAARGGGTGGPSLDGSAFRLAREVTLELPTHGGATVAADVDAWVAGLGGVRVDRLSLAVAGAEPAASLGIGRWAIVGHAPTRTLTWTATWDVGSTDAGTDSEPPRIWRVAYALATHDRVVVPAAPPVDAASGTLRDAVAAAVAFADTHGLAPFDLVLADALSLVDGGDPAAGTATDLLPDGWPAEARRLLDVASRAWVFGGMGSWNDVAFSDPATSAAYGELTGGLYRAVLTAIVAASNAGP